MRFFKDFIQSFFFNMPMRGMVELYLELCFISLLNMKYIYFGDFTQASASVLGMISSAVCLYFPFFCMTVIWSNRDKVSTRKWELTWGMLSEDTSTTYMMQLNYYPIFIYQRFYFCFCVVFLNDYPVIQVVSVVTGSVAMAVYLIINRPFRLEKQ